MSRPARHIDPDLVPAGGLAIIGRVADGIAAVKLLAEFLNGVFQSPLAVKAELHPASGLSESLDRIVFKDGLRIPE